MKSYKVFAYLLIALPALLLQSCLKDDDDKFSESSSARAEEYVTAAQDTLMSSANGWILDYYPQSSQEYGGFTYAIKFTKDDATVYFENQPGKAETSLYSMKNDDGPVLSFDTYNSMIHYYATPSSSMNNGYEGDFEFVIDSIGYDKIKVHGKRSMNTMYFRRLNEPADEYINKVVDMGDNFGLYAAVGQVGGHEGQAMFDRSSRQVQITVDSTSVVSAYNYTDKGIKLYQPVTINGVTIDEINADNENLTLSADNGTQLTGIYDPTLITNAIGSVGSDDRAFTRTFNRLAHLDQFNVVSQDDWCTVTTNGNSLTVSGTENTTGDIRSTTVYVVSKLTNQVYSTFTVSQMNQSDILGNYNFLYYDYDNTLVRATASIRSSRNGLTLNVSTNLLGSDFDFVFPCQFSQSNGALAIQSGQIIYPDELTLTSSDGSRINGWIMSALGFNEGNYFSAFYDSFYGYMPFAHNDRYGTYATLGTVSGSVLPGTYDFSSIIIYFTTSQTPSSSDDLAGMIDQWTNCTLIKQTASGAKGNVIKVTNGREKKMNHSLRSLPSQGFKLIK